MAKRRWFDNLLGRFGAQPSRPSMRRNVVAAGAFTNLTAGFGQGGGSANRDVYGALKTVRQRSRWLAYNNDYVRKYLAMVETHVVGPSGFGLQVRAKFPDGKLDETGNGAVEAAFAKWAARGSCEVTGRLSFRELSRLAARTVARDGECLIRKVYGRAAGNPEMFALQVIDIDRLDINKNAVMPGGNVVKMGVEVTPLGRPVAYWLDRKHPGEDLPSASLPGGEERVPADQIYYLGILDRPEQTRCLPWVVSALLRLKHLGAYEEAAVVAANIGAAKMGFFTTPDGEGVALADAKDANGEYVTEATPGQFSVLPEGSSFQSFDPTYPHEQFPQFVKASLRGIASGLGVSYNGLANDLENVNYSSLRAGVLEERDAWMSLQAWMTDALLRPLYADWLAAALLAGTVKTSRGAPIGPDKFDKFNVPQWIGRRWTWVDPLKDVEANIAAIRAGLKSRREIISEQGRDIEEVWQDLAAEQARAAELGLSFDVTTDPRTAGDQTGVQP